jgi:hypothetical protein
MGAPSFFSELKRRQIYRGGVMYIVAGWVIVQVATTVFPYFSIPAWAIRLVVVAILLGFPIALVSLWMFESTLPDPESRLHERRQGGNRDATGDFVKLMEAERVERQRENLELIAALKSGQPAAQMAQSSPVPDLEIRPPTPTPPLPTPNKKRVSILLSVFAVLILLSGVWALVAPQDAIQPVELSGQLAKSYVVPGFKQVEHFGVSLLTPVLDKFGIPIAPERVFLFLMVLLALAVVRDFYRQLGRSRQRAKQY